MLPFEVMNVGKGSITIKLADGTERALEAGEVIITPVVQFRSNAVKIVRRDGPFIQLARTDT